MTSAGYIFSRDRMYDAQERLIAKKNSHGQYIDKRGNVRATEQNHVSDAGPYTFDHYGREVGQLSSSAPGRRPPSNEKERSTSGSIHYPDG